MAWEYQIVTSSGADEEDEAAALNELGAEGWELVTVLQSEVYVEEEGDSDEESEYTETVLTYYFKRQS